MSIKDNLVQIQSSLASHVTLIVVTKTHPVNKLMEVYNANYKLFGENKVQELCDKYEALPKDIEWHLIGHLQTNKVKYIAPFISLIHSIDSLKLLQEVNKYAIKNNRIIKCLLQVYIAKEDTKFGFSFQEVEHLLQSGAIEQLHNIKIVGLMGMASNSEDKALVASEFNGLKLFFEKQKKTEKNNFKLEILSMGMSSDYQLAIENGSTMIRVGSSILGYRN